MPFYQVFHSYPLSLPQKQSLASAITSLHSRKFKTPSLFVNVKFHAEDASEDEYFMAGQVRNNATNRIMAMVRTSEQRTKKDFDALAEKVESAWYDVVIGELQKEGKEEGKETWKRAGENEQTETDRNAKKLLFVVFHPMIAALENGVVIPGVSSTFYSLRQGQGHCHILLQFQFHSSRCRLPLTAFDDRLAKKEIG